MLIADLLKAAFPIAAKIWYCGHLWSETLSTPSFDRLWEQLIGSPYWWVAMLSTLTRLISIKGGKAPKSPPLNWIPSMHRLPQWSDRTSFFLQLNLIFLPIKVTSILFSPLKTSKQPHLFSFILSLRAVLGLPLDSNINIKIQKLKYLFKSLSNDDKMSKKICKYYIEVAAFIGIICSARGRSLSVFPARKIVPSTKLLN